MSGGTTWIVDGVSAAAILDIVRSCPDGPPSHMALPSRHGDFGIDEVVTFFRGVGADDERLAGEQG